MKWLSLLLLLWALPSQGAPHSTAPVARVIAIPKPSSVPALLKIVLPGKNDLQLSENRSLPRFAPTGRMGPAAPATVSSISHSATSGPLIQTPFVPALLPRVFLFYAFHAFW
jgi:hypothetical protein